MFNLKYRSKTDLMKSHELLQELCAIEAQAAKII